MKKMLLAGCSHSAGYGLEDIEQSWGNIFAKNNNHILTNVAKPASSLQYATQSIINTISNESFDTVILQLTTFDRYPISYNGYEKFLNNDILSTNESEDKIFHLVLANYLEAVNGNDVPIESKYVRFFYEKVVFSTFYLNTLINEIFILQELLKHKGVDFILIPYDNYFWGNESKMSIWRLPESKKIDKTRYVDYPFMKWLEDNYTSEDYFLDKGFHLNEAGHKIFAEEYLTQFITLK